MARDLSVEVREFVVEAMAADAPPTPVRALCGDQIFGPSEPATPGWPFVRTDLPVTVPDPEGCGDDTRCTFNIHGFAKGKDERPGAALGAAIAATVDQLSGKIVDAPEAWITDTVWTGTQVFTDTAEEDGWHAVVSVYCKVAG